MSGEEKKFTTISGMPIDRVYTPDSLENFDYGKKLGQPGEYPFTRGIEPNMYRDNYWIMGQYSGFSTAEEANKRYKYLIEQGQTGFSVALDLPTQMGYDSDHPKAEGEVGKVGVALSSLADLETLFDGIDLQKVKQIRTTANATGLVTMAMVVAFARKNNIDPKDIRFFLQNDVLKEYFCRGTFIVPPRAGVKLSVDVIEYCAKNLPSWTPLSITGYHIRDSGATAVQEIAFALANGMCYIDEAIKRGVSIDDFGHQLFMHLSSGVDLLEEVAKFRVLRRLWAKIMKERYKSANEATQKLHLFCFTLGGALTAQQPLNNIVRVTFGALAAVLGGAQTLATCSFDEALSIPTEQAVTVALRTQQIIAYESGVTRTVDPLGGSYYLEKLTDDMEKAALDYIERIETRGGAISCIESGYYQKELGEAAYQYQKEVDQGERVIVGVNKFVTEDKSQVPVFKVDEQSEKRQIERINSMKAKRDQAKVTASLEKLEMAARRDENLGDPMIEAVYHYATIGEVCDVLRKVYGSYRPPTIF